MCSVQSKTFYKPPCKIQAWHHITCQIEQKAWLFVSSLATAHQEEDNEWIWTWNTVTVVCFVMQFVIMIYSTVHPSSIWHIVTFPYPCIVCDIIFYYLPCWHRHQTQASPRNSAWKQCLQDERNKWEKIKKRACERFFFSATVHGFLISFEITERDELSRVMNPTTRASPTHPHALMELHEFPLLLFNGDGYPNKWAAFAWLSTAGSH